MTDIVERLRGAVTSYDEWRVQDPVSGAYCIAFSWPEVSFPEREARRWLANHKERFPVGLHSGYEVACVRVMPDKDRLLQEAADEIERLRSAITAHIDGIERWLETGVPAGPEESKAIYEQLCRAVGREPQP